MELENLKTIWKEVGTTEQGTSAAELEQLLSKKSKSPIAKLKRTLLWELVFVVFIYFSTIVYYLAKNEPGMSYFALMLVVVGALYVWYYVVKRRLLKQMECVTCEVKSNLSNQLKTLEKYLKLYLWAGTLLAPVLLIGSGIVVYFYSPDLGKLPMGKNEFFPYFFLGMFIISLIITVPLYFLNKLYIHLLYGRHVKKIRTIVQELNELPFQ
jgi:hypothetical protein